VLEKVRENRADTVRALLVGLASELDMPVGSIMDFGGDQLRQLIELAVVLVKEL
jgi:hypothetical protein